MTKKNQRHSFSSVKNETKSKSFLERFPVLNNLLFMFLGIFLTVYFTNTFIPFIANSILKKDQLIDVKLYPMPTSGLSSDITRYVLDIVNNDKEYSVNSLYVTLDFPLPVEGTLIRADQGALAVAASQGVVPVLFQNNQITKIPTNHLNVSAQEISPNGLVSVDIFLTKKSNAMATPFPNIIGGKVVYSFNFWGSEVRKNMDIPITQ